jgi:hypothetical protein
MQRGKIAALKSAKRRRLNNALTMAGQTIKVALGMRNSRQMFAPLEHYRSLTAHDPL